MWREKVPDMGCMADFCIYLIKYSVLIRTYYFTDMKVKMFNSFKFGAFKSRWYKAPL